MKVDKKMLKKRSTRKEYALVLGTRRQIFQFILKYPGLHFRELSRKLKIPKTTLSYHLKYLEKRGFINVKSEGRYTRLYAKNKVGSLDKKIIHILRQETPRNIILHLVWTICASQTELSKELEKTHKTIEFHLKRLINAGVVEPAPLGDGVIYTGLKTSNVIERTPVGNEVIYRLARTKNPDVDIRVLVGDLFILYGKGLVNDNTTRLILDGIRIMYPDITQHKKKLANSTNEATLNRFEKRIYDIFPHPYHA